MATVSPVGRADGPSRSSLDSAIDKEGEKTAIDGSLEESASDTASDIRVQEAAPTSTSAPHRADAGIDGSTVDPSALHIEHRYFTYATELPPPNTSPCRAANDNNTDLAAAPPPPPPNLKPFTDPHLWSDRRKYTMLALSCIATFLTAYCAGSFSPPVQRMSAAFGTSSTVTLFAGITVYCLGFALAPMLMAPLSEYNGRYPVFVFAGCVMLVFQVVSGAAPDVGAMLVARLLVGVGGSVFSTVVGGVIADMWHAEGRNTPMALFSGCVFFATGCGPLVSAVITYRTTYPQNAHDVATDTSVRAPWRWVFWHQVIADAVLMVALVFLFHESRGSVLLSRKAKALNAWYTAREAAGYFGVWLPADDDDARLPPLARQSQRRVEGEPKTTMAREVPSPSSPGPTSALRRVRWVVKDDEDRTTVWKLIGMSVYRPFHMFFTEPVVFFFSLWVAFAWAVLYLTFGSIFLVFEEVYDFNMQQAGYTFSSMFVGAAVATVMGLYQDRYLLTILPLPAALRARFQAGGVPEARLCGACVTSILLPVGLFIFGFTARPDYHWIAPVFGIGISTVGIFAIYLSTFNYLADVYHRFASSALAAQGCCRNVLGGIFPLVMRPLFTNMGIARAGALLGAIGTGLTLVPWVLLYFGDRIRRRSKFAQALAT
ncbi:hypothetical protein HMPREF1624_03898 [Sporothrix schenckii ATCC 58251]|uniref:Major facilitator superfamily (MFS) profile domain-containing protein n=1 Tax=Sporothrix schenckii (strain ATCC 58251 / de Perez 2211183) TaxID=1391915 RepID=U7Q0L1_SPOS1|nr:hypothetical protein HMPREF1624_03898 [Sporothrix schenckii ATCC 58251]